MYLGVFGSGFSVRDLHHHHLSEPRILRLRARLRAHGTSHPEVGGCRRGTYLPGFADGRAKRDAASDASISLSSCGQKFQQQNPEELWPPFSSAPTHSWMTTTPAPWDRECALVDSGVSYFNVKEEQHNSPP